MVRCFCSRSAFLITFCSTIEISLQALISTCYKGKVVSQKLAGQEDRWLTIANTPTDPRGERTDWTYSNLNYFVSTQSTEDCPVTPLVFPPEHTYLIMNLLILVSLVIWIGCEFSKLSSCGLFSLESSSLKFCLSSCILYKQQEEARLYLQHFA